ncbi:MAG: hypothetical protein PHO37_01565 [Kiritimatiellae bacterium]|nr:hypothetical protein [Kiritimatiellia bacterium]
MRKIFWMVMLAVSGWSVLGAEPDNLVRNPGFEERDNTGATVAWSERKPVYRFLDGCGRNGSRGLAFENSDPDFYSFPAQALEFKAGACYEFEVWVRSEGLHGEESGASICMEWSDAAGKYLGGGYAEGVRETGDGWVLIKGATRPIPENAHSVRVAPYVRRGMTGKAWFDDLRVTRYYPPAVSTVSASCYRHTAAAGQVTFSASLHLRDSGLKPAQVAGAFVFEDSRGREVKRLKPALLDEQRGCVTLEVAELPVGEYKVSFVLTAADGTARGAGSTSFRRVAQLPERRVHIDSHRRLIADGQPFFPLGMYWSQVKEPQLGVYAQAPFNCLMPYGSPATNQMDACHAYGLKVIYSIKDIYHGTQWAPPQIKSAADEREWIKRTVSLHRNHPALLAWYLNDELPLTMVDRLAARQRLMEELDPDHPTWVVLYQYTQVGDYLDTFDVIGTDPYPIPDKPAGMALEWTRVTRDQSHGSRAIWQVPQVFDWGGYRKGEAREKTRPPTLPEMRTMAWQCIAAGANGLVFYSFFDLHKMNERDPFDKRWADVCAMAAEIKGLIPVLLSVEPTPVIVVDAPDAVETRLWKHAGALYLLVVNGSEERVTAEIKVEGAYKSVESQFGPQPVSKGDQGLRFTLPPLEPVMVRLEE